MMSGRKYQPSHIYWPMMFLMVLGVFLSITKGPIVLPPYQSFLTIWDQVWGTEFNNLAKYEQVVVFNLRLPRTLLALTIGALLAICGAVTQGLFRNPLADPGIIGISTGAGLGAAISIVLLPASIAMMSTPVFAFVGGLATTLLVYRLSYTSNGTSVIVLLLAGVAIAAFAGAIIGFLTFIADDQSLRDLTLWGMGSLNGANFGGVALSALVLFLLLYFFLKDAKALNALLVGEPEARYLGIDIERLKLRLIVLTAIGIGVCVSLTGVIGFLGLVVPHLIRLILGPDHRFLLPLSALTGSVLLLISDLASRLLMSPAELPVGLMTALFGAPFFTLLLLHQRKRLL